MTTLLLPWRYPVGFVDLVVSAPSGVGARRAAQHVYLWWETVNIFYASLYKAEVNLTSRQFVEHVGVPFRQIIHRIHRRSIFTWTLRRKHLRESKASFRSSGVILMSWSFLSRSSLRPCSFGRMMRFRRWNRSLFCDCNLLSFTVLLQYGCSHIVRHGK